MGDLHKPPEKADDPVPAKAGPADEKDAGHAVRARILHTGQDRNDGQGADRDTPTEFVLEVEESGLPRVLAAHHQGMPVEMHGGMFSGKGGFIASVQVAAGGNMVTIQFPKDHVKVDFENRSFNVILQLR